MNHLNVKDVPEDSGLRGVPLLVFSFPDNKVAYVGGYGAAGNEDNAIYAQIKSGTKAEALPVRGFAVGERLRRSADPFVLNLLEESREDRCVFERDKLCRQSSFKRRLYTGCND